MPQIGEIDIQVMEEGQSRWLSFIKDEVDLFALDGELTVQALRRWKTKTGIDQERCTAVTDHRSLY